MEERPSPEASAGNSRAEDDFRSCCGDEEEWEDTEESFTAGVAKGELDEASVRLFFKGVSSPEAEGKKLSSIGVRIVPGVPVLPRSPPSTPADPPPPSSPPPVMEGAMDPPCPRPPWSLPAAAIPAAPALLSPANLAAAVPAALIFSLHTPNRRPRISPTPAQ